MLFKWENGRQNSGYKKLLLFKSNLLFKCDLYLLSFSKGSEIKPHVDKVDFGNHYRLNIVFKKPQIGGDFICNKTIVNMKRIILFRPDLYEHSVSKIKSGKRLVLSFGFLL